MPTKFVQNVAHKTGTSVEHAEKVWQDAKHAVKKGKRQGSWYWGKVVNTFKRMMGLKESITFAEFNELLESDQGQYKNDAAERAMIHKIVKLATQNRLMKGGNTDANLEQAYDFLESDWGGLLWDKYYELFKQMSPDYEGPFDRRKYGSFGREAVSWFLNWKKGVKLPKDVQPLEKMHEEISELDKIVVVNEDEAVTIPKLLKQQPLPKFIMIGKGGYYLKFISNTAIKVKFDVGRIPLAGETPDIKVVVVLRNFPAQGRAFLVQAGGDSVDYLNWDERSKFVAADGKVNPLTPSFLKQFMLGVLDQAELLNEDKVKPSYIKGLNPEEKAEMKREIKRFSKMSHKDKDAYPEDWTADKKYKERLKKKGKSLPKSEYTKEFERRYGK